MPYAPSGSNRNRKEKKKKKHLEKHIEIDGKECTLFLKFEII
jgi:hypothetical protein